MINLTRDKVVFGVGVLRRCVCVCVCGRESHDEESKVKIGCVELTGKGRQIVTTADEIRIMFR